MNEICGWCDKPESEELGEIEPHLMPLSAELYHNKCAIVILAAHKKVFGRKMPL